MLKPVPNPELTSEMASSSSSTSQPEFLVPETHSKKVLDQVGKMAKTFATPPHQEHPIGEVLEGRLWISNYSIPEDKAKLQELGITHVVNATTRPNLFAETFKYFHANLSDEIDQRIDELWHDAGAFIKDALNSQPTSKVLVHCNQGISRSSSLTIAYLIMHGNVNTLEEAHGMVKAGRPVACPNIGFFQQLLDLEKTKRKEEPSLPLVAYSLYSIHEIFPSLELETILGFWNSCAKNGAGEPVDIIGIATIEAIQSKHADHYVRRAHTTKYHPFD